MLQLCGERLGELEGHRVLAGCDHVHIERRHRGGPDETALVVVELRDDGQDAGDTDAVGAHGDRDELAVLVEHLQPQRLGVLAAELEDVPDLHPASQ